MPFYNRIEAAQALARLPEPRPEWRGARFYEAKKRPDSCPAPAFPYPYQGEVFQALRIRADWKRAGFRVVQGAEPFAVLWPHGLGAGGYGMRLDLFPAAALTPIISRRPRLPHRPGV